MTDLVLFINTLINLNSNDELYITKDDFYNNCKINNIIEKYGFKGDKGDKLYKFAIYLLKIKNNKLEKSKQLCNVINIDCLIFNNLMLIEKTKVYYFCGLFVGYLYNKINFKTLSDFIGILQNLNFTRSDIKFGIDYKAGVCTDKKIGESLVENGLAEKSFGIVDFEYRFNQNGKSFFNNIYFDITAKEKEIYSKVIDYSKMSNLDNVIEHKKYYDTIIKEIENNKNLQKVARLHDRIFKKFFEEYNVLIKYAMAKYGKKCSIQFCGEDTNKEIKYDGIIKIGKKIDKVEITAPLYGEEEKNQINLLNRTGIVSTMVSQYENFEYGILKKVENAINKKNKMDSYDNTIDLVVFFDQFEYLFSRQISDKKYIDSIFVNLKENQYKFKSVSILIDEYISNKICLKPRIIKIK